MFFPSIGGNEGSEERSKTGRRGLGDLVSTNRKGPLVRLIFEFLYLDLHKSQDGDTPDIKAVTKRAKQLLGALENLGSPDVDGDDRVFSYCNDATGVTARFIAYEPEHADEVGLAFEMDLPRPTFFAFEALPAALCVAREKRLGLEVLQEEGSKLLESPSFEDLLDLWREANERAVASNGRPYRRGCSETLESMWEFSLVRKDLARRYGRSRIEVPPLYTVVHKRTGEVSRMVDWDGLNKVALGESDWVRLVNPPDPLKDGAIYDTEELTLACKPLIRSVPQPIFHYLCEKPKIISELVERIEPLKRVTMRSFEVVGLDEIFDEQGLSS